MRGAYALHRWRGLKARLRAVFWAAAVLAISLLALVIGAAGDARANGAFPAGEGVLVPADRPQQIILVTNFGIVLTDDGGQTWSWSCERDANSLGVLYQLGPGPRRRLFAVANQHVVYSDDASCSWQIAAGLVAGQSVTDVFPDPGNADRVLAIAVAGAVHAVFESADGGATFGAELYRAASGDVASSVESARGDPRVVYVGLMGADKAPKLARSGDGGAHWTVSDLSADLGPGMPRIIAVDPDDADTVLLRFASTTGGESLAVTRDGGATATKSVTIPFYFTSFARMPDGGLVASGVVAVTPTLTPALFVSHDRGASFKQNGAVLSVLALGQRAGILYAAADNFRDGFALGASSDEGATWQPVVRFDQIGSITACLRGDPQCRASCEALAGKGVGSPGMIWEEAVCTTSGAAGASGGGGSAGAATAGSGGGSGAGGVAPRPSGDHCAVARDRSAPGAGALALAAGMLTIAVARRPLRRARPRPRRAAQRVA